VVAPVLGNVVPVEMYEPNTWGPVDALKRLAPPGGWNDPVIDC
jgi:glucose-6-phosphate 1-dehydrogenase